MRAKYEPLNEPTQANGLGKSINLVRLFATREQTGSQLIEGDPVQTTKPLKPGAPGLNFIKEDYDVRDAGLLMKVSSDEFSRLLFMKSLYKQQKREEPSQPEQIAVQEQGASSYCAI